jgi:hypothetical protein
MQFHNLYAYIRPPSLHPHQILRRPKFHPFFSYEQMHLPILLFSKFQNYHIQNCEDYILIYIESKQYLRTSC